MIEKLQHFDRRWIFLILFLAICGSIMHPVSLSVPIEPYVQRSYDTINALKPGDHVLMAFDYGPSTAAEIHPAALAMLRHALSRGAKVIMFTLWNEAVPYIQEAINEVCVPLGKKTNVDYVNFGFKSGGTTGASVIEGMGSNLKAVFPITDDGTPYDGVPALQGVENLKDFKVLISISAGTPGIDEYVRYANARYKIPIVAAVTRVSAPKEFPYVTERQIYGLCAGLVGGAEYEELIKYPGAGTAGLFPLSVANLAIILFIVFGNLIYFLGRIGSRKP